VSIDSFFYYLLNALISECTNMYLYSYKYIYIYVCVRACVRACVRVCVEVYRNIYIYEASLGASDIGLHYESTY